MRSMAIKTKNKFIQIVGQLGRSDGTLIRSQKPPFKQRGDQVRQFQFLGGKDFSWEALFRQLAISGPIIRFNHAARGNHLLYKSTQAAHRGVPYLGQANSAKSLGGLIFNDNRHQGFSLGSTPRFSRFFALHIRFIHLNATRQLISARSHHGTPQVVEPFPRRLVAAQIQYLLQSQSIGPIFLAGNVPHRSKPKGKRFMRSMKNGPGSNRSLSATLLAMPKAPLCLPSKPALAFRANKSIGPTHLSHIFQAGRLCSKSFFKFSQGPGKILHNLKYYIWESLESSR
jgi:hypothetical protein